MARILSIDYGRKRTGIAVTDPLQIIANGLTTVASSQLIDFLTQYMQRESVERVVVGLPRQMNNQPSESMRYITPFVNRFRKLFPNVPIEFFDERFTSVLAHRAMIDGGLSKMARRNKELVDEISATKPRFFPLIPLSTNAWVRKGNTSCNKLPSNIPSRRTTT